MAHRTTPKATPLPWEMAKSFQLQVVKSCCDWAFSDISQPDSAMTRTVGIYSITMSPVLNVVLFGIDELGHKFHFQAILKLYDRRFGERLRMCLGEHVPHTAERELAFQSFVRRGMMDRFLRRREEVPEGEETQRPRGKKLEGSINLLDSPDTAQYFEVKGVILERVPGYPLNELPTSPLAPSNMVLWPGIVQAAVDAVHEVDSRGVLNNNCAPYNIVVNCRSHTPFIVYFASCDFKELLIQRWKDTGRMDDDDDPEIEYWEEVVTANNEGAIGAAMTARLRRMKGLELKIRYPNSQKILEDTKKSKGIESTKDRTGSSGWKIMY
ncbi:uncharacterized protein B0H64DRAFT_465733 [Chaetomium fimeti]|uniref:Uncharacterized protein n=1 Tax=Chaetomium fimeti TaxID=1854472 RepID=A0AAE0LQF2_9PEZI|nr:hypothetical protein B0H64DRAFT_465733 [Chaetomium fimeti]